MDILYFFLLFYFSNEIQTKQKKPKTVAGTPNQQNKRALARNFVKNRLIHGTLTLFVINLSGCLTHQIKVLI